MLVKGDTDGGFLELVDKQSETVQVPEKWHWNVKPSEYPSQRHCRCSTDGPVFLYPSKGKPWVKVRTKYFRKYREYDIVCILDCN